jgi:hypothetical protein
LLNLSLEGKVIGKDAEKSKFKYVLYLFNIIHKFRKLNIRKVLGVYDEHISEFQRIILFKRPGKYLNCDCITQQHKAVAMVAFVKFHNIVQWTHSIY